MRTPLNVLVCISLVAAAAIFASTGRPTLVFGAHVERGTSVSHIVITPKRGLLSGNHVLHHFPQAKYVTGNVTYHGGSVMHHAVNYAIFWLPPGYHFEPTGSDATFESLIERYFNDVGASPMYNLLTQYPDGKKQTNDSHFGGFIVDTTPLPSNGCMIKGFPICLSDQQLQNEIVNAMGLAGWTPGPSKEFFLFQPSGVQNCEDASSNVCSNNVYCAYHGEFGSANAPVIYANMPQEHSIGGCETYHSPNNDISADDEINIISHEEFEGVTDPDGFSGWYYKDTDHEIGDECDFVFGRGVNSSGANEILNGHPYIVQREWSDAASGCAGSLCAKSVCPPNGSITVSGPPSLTRRQVVTFSIGAANSSRVEPATKVKIIDTLPAGLTYVAGSASRAPTSIVEQTLTWSLGALPVSQQEPFTFSARATAGLSNGDDVRNCASMAFDNSLGKPQPTKSACNSSIVGGPIVVTSPKDHACSPVGAITLRCAIHDANGSAGASTISFDISNHASGCGGTPVVCTIAPSSPLPALTAKSIFMDGYSQPGALANTLSADNPGGPTADNATIAIRLDGGRAPSGTAGLTIQGSNDTVSGLAITGFSGPAIRIFQPSGVGDTVTGDFLGVTPSGVAAANGTGAFVSAGASRATIGGIAAGSANVVSGNHGFGLNIHGGTATSIQGNLIGVQPNGKTKAGNRVGGVSLGSSATGNVSNNLVWGNGGPGIRVGTSTTDNHTHVQISKNSIYENTGLGIDLAGVGVVVCAPSATGPNGHASCPRITTATTANVDGTACGACVVEIVITGTPQSASGHGQGLTYLATVTAGATGAWSYTLPTAALAKGQYITATATSNVNGDVETSEFAANVQVK